MKGQLLYQFSNKDNLYQYGRGIILSFHGRRRVLSSSMLNGGISDTLSAVFNYNCLADDYDCMMQYDSYEEELKHNALNLELDPENVSGLSTAAFMECAAIQTESYEDIQVTACVTGGIDYNAVSVGDPASYCEKSNVYTPLTPGTINILLHINHAMPAGALVRASVMCTEAKAAAISELMIGSNYSNQIATGSGTDGIIIVSDLESKDTLNDAGGHSKLGELIGICVKAAVKQALNNQTSVSPARQHSILQRGKRYGINISSFYQCYLANDSSNAVNFTPKQRSRLTIQALEQELMSYHQNSNLVIFSICFFHLLDEYRWRMIEWPEILRETKSFCRWFLTINHKKDFVLPVIDYATPTPMEELLNLFQYTILIRLFC